MKTFENPTLEKISFDREILTTSGADLKFTGLGGVNYNSDKTVNVGSTDSIFN